MFQRLDTRFVMRLRGKTFNLIAGKNNHSRTLQLVCDWEEILQICQESIAPGGISNSLPNAGCGVESNAQGALLIIHSAEIFRRPFFELIDQLYRTVARLRNFLQPLLERKLLINRP